MTGVNYKNFVIMVKLEWLKNIRSFECSILWFDDKICTYIRLLWFERMRAKIMVLKY